MLTFLILLPIAGALAVWLLPAARPEWVHKVALGAAAATLLWAGLLVLLFDNGAAGLQFVERAPWIEALGAEYFLGADGMSMLLVLLATLVGVFAIAASGPGGVYGKNYYGLILLLQATVLGVFTAQSFLLWFLFWELSLVPAFLLIRLWGGPNRAVASMRFFTMTMVGGIAMLAAFLALFRATGTFAFSELAEMATARELAAGFEQAFPGVALSTQAWIGLVFGGIFLGLAVKVPLMPFHRWLPEAYIEAPTPVAMLLTGVMSKMGIYGFLRILAPVFPDMLQTFLTPLLVLAAATVVFSALAALQQKDLKGILAYSSVNHLGYCLLGTFAAAGALGAGATAASAQSAALSGTLLQAFNHGITASALFCFVGFLEVRRGGLRGLNDFGGARKAAPVFCGLMGIGLFSSLGLPGLNGFPGEFLIFRGVFPLAPWAAAVSLIGLLATAVIMLRILIAVFYGPQPEGRIAFPDLTWRERLTVAPAVALMLAFGIFPQPLLALLNGSVSRLVEVLS
jgi:NADH-quinone oxidoreductase subunit M